LLWGTHLYRRTEQEDDSQGFTDLVFRDVRFGSLSVESQQEQDLGAFFQGNFTPFAV